MATISTRHREKFCKPTESIGSSLIRENFSWKRDSEANKLSVKNKQCNTISKALISAVKEDRKSESFAKQPTMVKTSALLYEITDRINQLAQPRRLNTDDKNNSQQPKLTNRIPQATPRLIELSQPRTIFQPIKKPSCYVSPNALKAIATERILELSKPRKRIDPKVSQKKKIRRSYAVSSNRLEYLSKPRLFHRKLNIKTHKGYNKFLNRTSKNTRNNSKSSKKYKKSKDEDKKRKQFLEASNSSRSVIVVSSFGQCNKKSKSGGTQSKKRANKKSTSLNRYIRKKPKCMLSNSEDRFFLRRCDAACIYLPNCANFNNKL